MNSYKPVSKLTIKLGQIGKPVMLYHERREASSPLHQARALVHTPAPWTYLGLDTAPRSEALSLIKRRSIAGTTTCVYTVARLAIGPPNVPTNDQGVSPLLRLLPPLKEVCLFLLLCLFCLLLLLHLPKSSMRQKTNFRCK